MGKNIFKTIFSGCLITIAVIIIGLFILFNIDEGSDNNVNKLNTELALIHKIDTTKIQYQYYQKYGFTDACKNIVMISKLNKNPKLKKRLPISVKDLKEIELSNCHFYQNKGIITFDTNRRYKQRDIEIEFNEFKKDNLLKFNTNEGWYEFSKKQDKKGNIKATLKMYSDVSKLYYFKEHSCGN